VTPEVALDGIVYDRDGRRVLDGASLRLNPGERIALRGPNGAGKTTLLRLIAGLARPLAGEVRLAGRLCRGEADFRRARPVIGFLFQDSDDQLFSPTVVEDVAFGPLNQGLSRPEAFALARWQLGEFGLAALADRPVQRLSGGEKRLVCLAGLFAMKPRVLLLDEPTNGLDAEAEARLLDHLRAFAGAQIIVTHDAEVPRHLGARCLKLTQGRLRPETA
jgi:cobalt/nickel transport system ATP-binding protein